MKIKIIFTGGTISCELSEKVISVNSTNYIQKLLIENFFKKTNFKDVQFEISQPLNVLSENMTINNWNAILKELRNTNFSDYDGIIITHGTDTLAYTSNMLSIMLVGINIPVVLVSSNYVLTDEKSNGNNNFLNAVFFIKEKKYRGVYAIYQDDNGKSKVYFGSRLKQCSNITNKFSSINNIDFGEMINQKFFPIIDQTNPTTMETKISDSPPLLLLNQISNIYPCVLLLSPYTGFDYNNITPTPLIKAILHSSYHGGTASIISNNQYSSSIIDFYICCKGKGIDFYIAPLEKAVLDNYSSTTEILNSGIISLYDISIELAYAKLTIAYSVNDEKLRDFIINDNTLF